ncbi:MAG TPA: hypothetical protein VF516_23565 [Kofleriaceae bacterium]
MNLKVMIIQLCFVIFLFLIMMLLIRIRRRKRRARRPGMRNRKESSRPCATVTPQVYRRPDPMIYDQYYLMKQGIAVTWDNPDIHLELGGVTVPSESLLPSTTYDVVARIWNGSTDAPAVNMPVRFSYLTFGIGQKQVPIGETLVNLPVKGAPGCPSFARVKWTTPSVAGHYCLQVELVWSDDANPGNNLGQENTNVKALNSPRAKFTFPVANDTGRDQILVLEADTYAVPARRPCRDQELDRQPDANPERQKPRSPADEIARRQRDAQALHDRRAYPVPTGWRVDIEPRELVLAPGAEQEVTVDITAIDGYVGRQVLNVHAFDVSVDRDHRRLVGGVTLYVTGTG